MTTEQMTLWPGEDTAQPHDPDDLNILRGSETLTEIRPIWRFVPNEPCYVSMLGVLGNASRRIDEVRVNNGHISFKVSQRPMTSDMSAEEVPWAHVDELIPAQLTPFRSGVWCRGNDEINRMIEEDLADGT